MPFDSILDTTPSFPRAMRAFMRTLKLEKPVA